MSERGLKTEVGERGQGRLTTPRWLRRLGDYGLALVLVAAAATLRWAMPEVLGPTPFLAFYLAWVGAAAFGGLGPGLLATAASWVCIDLLFDPAGSLINFADLTTIGRLAVLLSGGLTVSLVAEAMRRGRARERGQARELARAKQEWERTFDAVPDLIAIIDPQHRILRANRTMAERLRASPEGCIGLTCYHCVHNLDAPLALCPHEEALADGREHSIEIHEERLGGYFFVTCTPLYDEHGTMIGTVHVARDITERKRAEILVEEARKSLEREKEILQSVMNGARRSHLVYLDRNFNFVRVNEAYARTCGYTPEEMVGKNHFVLYPHAENEAIFSRVRDTGEPAEFHDKPFVFPDQPERGTTYWDWTLSPVKNEAGEVEGLVFALFETTERKRVEEALKQANERLQEQAEELQTQAEELQAQAEELTTANEELRDHEQALRESEQRYHQLFRDDLTGDFISTPEGQILLCNPAFARIFGFSGVEEVAGTNMLELYIDTRERESLVEMLRQRGKIERLEVWRKRRDGRPIYVVENLVGRFDEQGRLQEIKGYIFDDTDRKRAEEALRELNATLESKVAQRTAELRHRARQLQKLTLDMSEAEDRERKRLAEILHDDLQQILAAAKFHLGLVKHRVGDGPSLQATVIQIDHMLKDAIEKSRSLSHELSPAVLHHGDFAEALGWLAGQIQAKHGLLVHVRTHGEVGLESDALKAFLFKATQELLFNVVKHARVNEASIRVRRMGRWIGLMVCDRGRGFDPQELGKTLGFGLFSIRERVEMLGGRMKIRSAEGRGSTFSMVVPDGELARADVDGTAAPTPNVRATSDGRAKSHDGGRLRVLLADDHAIVREGLILLLSEEQMIEVVGQASNGREAVDLAGRLQPDVVVMDVSMPLINGDEATRQIKRHLPNTRVVALSMFDEPDTIERMRAAGAEAYVLKTAPSEELLAAIRGRQAGPAA